MKHEPLTQDMSALQLALWHLQQLRLTLQQVRRVSVERQGVIHIEVHERDRHRFFVFQGNQLVELRVEDDTKIPTLKMLGRSDFAAKNTIISYRPGRRVVIGPAGDQPGNIIKGYKKHRSAKAAEYYRIAQAACQAGGFDVPELLSHDARRDCLVIKKRPGHTPRIDQQDVMTWLAIGVSLRSFQNAPVVDQLQVFSPQDELAVLKERARRFLRVEPGLPKDWQNGYEYLADAAEKMHPTHQGVSHRDLHDGQFIVAGETISLLDFDQLCVADVALDAGNLLAHMQLRAMQGQAGAGGAVVEECSDAFRRGLGRQEEAGFDTRVLFYQATTFYRLALLYALRPRWLHLTAGLIDKGSDCIDGMAVLRDHS